LEEKFGTCDVNTGCLLGEESTQGYCPMVVAPPPPPPKTTNFIPFSLIYSHEF